MSSEDNWRAIRAAEARLARARKTGDRQEEGNALVELGLCQQEIEQFGEAIASLEQALVLLRPFQEKADEALTLCSLGSCYLASGKAARAFALFDEALALARKSQDGSAEFTCLYQLGMAATTLEKAQTAISSFQQALTIARIQGQKTEEIHTLGALGAAYLRAGQPQDAITCHEQARALAQQAGDLDAQAYELGNLGSAYASALGQVDVGVDYYLQALTLFQQLGDEANCAKTLANIGLVYTRAKRAQAALPYLEQARSLALQLGDRALLSSILDLLGEVEERSGNLAEAIRRHEQAVAAARGRGDRQQEEHSLNELALLWKRSGYLQKAITSHRDALALAQARRDPLAEARQLGNIALVLGEAKNHEAALLLHTQALLLFQAEGDLQGEGRTLVYMAMSAFSLKRNAKTLAFLRLGQALLQGSHTLEEGLIPTAIEQVRTHLGATAFQRAWRASEYHLRRLHIQRYWAVTGICPLRGESGSSLDPCLCSAGETWPLGFVSQEGLAEWAEAKAFIDPEAWRTVFARFTSMHAADRPRKRGGGSPNVHRLGALGCAYAETGYLEAAFQKFDQALTLARSQNEYEDQQLLLLSLSSLELRLARLEEAEALFHEAVRLLHTFEDDLLLLARGYRRIGVAFRLFDTPHRAHVYLEEARSIAHANGHGGEEGWALSELGIISTEAGHAQKALDFHTQALAIFRQQREQTWEQDQLLRLAMAQACAGKWAEVSETEKQVQAAAGQEKEWSDAMRAQVYLGILAFLRDTSPQHPGSHDLLMKNTRSCTPG